MDTATYIQEEFILQGITLAFFLVFFLAEMISELIERKKTVIDDLTKRKIKKLYQFAYVRLFNGNVAETKKNAKTFCKDLYKKNLIDEKYDLMKKRA